MRTAVCSSPTLPASVFNWQMTPRNFTRQKNVAAMLPAVHLMVR